MGKAKGKKKPSQPTKKEVIEAEVLPHRTIYVGNLSSVDHTEERLNELFAACGQITEVKLVSTANHAFGFLEFATVAEAEVAVEKMNGESGMLVKFAKNTSSSTAVSPSMSPTQPLSDPIEEADEVDEEEDEEEPEVSHACEKEESDAVAAITAAEARAAAAREYPNPVESLQVLVQRATRATSPADFITYIVEEDKWQRDELKYTGTVEVLVFGCQTSHTGKPCGNKKEAKTSAARVALRDATLHRSLPPLPAKSRETKVAHEAGSDDEGLEQDTVDPRAELIAELEAMTKGTLRRRAVALKIDEDILEKADDADDTKAAFIELILEIVLPEDCKEEQEEVVETFAPVLKKKNQQQLEKERKAAKRKAAKAAKAAAVVETSSEEEASEEEEQESEEDVESTDVDTEDSEEEDESSSETNQIHAAELAAKKAVIRAALAAKKDAKRRIPGAKSKSSDVPKGAKKVDKEQMAALFAERPGVAKVSASSNMYSTLGFKNQVGPKTHIAKP